MKGQSCAHVPDRGDVPEADAFRTRPTAAERIRRGRKVFEAGIPGVDLSYFQPVWSLLTLAHLTRVNLDQVNAGLGLTLGDAEILTMLKAASGVRLRPTDLARSFFVTRAALSERLRRLEQRGLIRRVPDGHDARASRLDLTEAGEAMSLHAIRSISQTSHFAHALRSLDAGDQAALIRILAKLHDAAYRLSDTL